MMDVTEKSAVRDKSILVCRSAALRNETITAVVERHNWFVNYVDSSDDMLKQLEQYPYDVVIVGIPADAEQTIASLSQVANLQPQTARIVVASHLKPTWASRIAEISHACLQFSCTDEQLATAIEQSNKVTALLHRPETQAAIDKVQLLPSALPHAYVALNNLLNTKPVNSQQIAAAFASNQPLAAQVLQRINTAYFADKPPLHSLNEAVTLLGLRVIRDITLSVDLFEHRPSHSEWSHFSFEAVYQRALKVACLAQDITGSMNMGRDMQMQAFLAGALLDFGLALLVKNHHAGYREVMVLSGKLKQPLYAIEKMHLGVSHAELGAKLLASWCLPPAVVEAVLFHHIPASSISQTFAPLTAVHVADALLTPVETDTEGAVLSSLLAAKYLERIGVSHMLPEWKFMAARYQ